VGVASPAFPVINSLLKASTSIDALPGLPIFDMPSPSRCGCSIVANVLENGFAGICLSLSTISASELCETLESNGSSLSSIACVECLYLVANLSSSIGEEFGKEGDGGGGDWTRTFFPTLFRVPTGSIVEDDCGGISA
jgi:hypothetical protein